MVTWKSQYDCQMKCTFYLIFARKVMNVVGICKKEKKNFIGSVKVNMKRKKSFLIYLFRIPKLIKYCIN